MDDVNRNNYIGGGEAAGVVREQWFADREQRRVQRAELTILPAEIRHRHIVRDDGPSTN